MGKIDTTIARIKSGGTGAAPLASMAEAGVAPPPPARHRAPSLADLSHFPLLSVKVHRLEDNRIIGFSSFAPLALSAYRMIRTRLLQTTRSNGWRTIALSSAGMGEGKSVTAINLALSISREGNQNIFLVDLDMRRPTIAKYLGVSPPHGVQEFFEGRVGPESIFFKIGPPGLVVAAATESRDNSSEMLSSDRLGQLIDYIFSQDPNALVLFDTPPLLVADDALAVAPRVDGTLLVATEGKTKRSDIAAASELVQKFGLVGIILNKSSETVAHYY